MSKQFINLLDSTNMNSLQIFNHLLGSLLIIVMVDSHLQAQVTLEPDLILFGRDALPANGEIVYDTFFYYDRDQAAFRGGYLYNSANWSPDSLGFCSFGFGRQVKVTGFDGAIALGTFSEARGNSGITAIGASSKVSGDYGATAIGWSCESRGSGGPMALGVGCQAIGNSGPIAIGRFAVAQGDYASVSIGNGTIANGQSCMALGRYNDTLVAANTEMSETSPILIVGNGDYANESNAMVILKNGNVGIGSNQPSDTLEVISADGSDALRIRNGTATQFRIFGNNSISIGSNNSNVSAGDVYFHNQIGMGVGTPTHRLQLANSMVDSVGKAKAAAWDTYSDGRVKSNIEPLRYSINELMNLRPVAYNHHSSEFRTDHELVVSKENFQRQIGFIAQEVYKIMPEIVEKPADETRDLWSMDYDRFAPVLVKSIQDQQQIIQDQSEQISELIQNQSRMQEELDLLKSLIAGKIQVPASATNAADMANGQTK
ncbi:MAG: tail fiber domain-containing protein [Saprospiraceae bacterium]|nr:tail fiber domain-containing protein [Saprospiraceae bacterium]